MTMANNNWSAGVANWGMGLAEPQHQGHPLSSNGMEDWASKARAWAAAKAAQEAALAQAQAQYQQQQQAQQAQAQQEHGAGTGGYYGNEWQHHQHQHHQQGQGHGVFLRQPEQQIRQGYGGHEAPPPSYSQDWEAWNARPWQDIHPHAFQHSHSQVSGPEQQAFHDYPPSHQVAQAQLLQQQQPQPEELRVSGPAAGAAYKHEVHMSFSQDSSTYPFEPPASTYEVDTTSNFAQDAPLASYVQDSASTSYEQASGGHSLVAPSSFSQDSSSFGQETAAAAPPGTEQQDHQQHPVLPPPLGLPNQQLPVSPTKTHVPPQSQQQLPHPPPLPQPQQQQFPYPYPPLPPYELQQHQQFEFQQSGHQEYPQQPPPHIMPSGPDIGYGEQPPLQGWPSLGPSGMSFPSAMGINVSGGPGGPQFEHHQHLQQPHGSQPPHVFGRPHGPNFMPPGPPLVSPFGFGGNANIGSLPGSAMGPMFPGDVNGNAVALDRPKKAAVPSWLREELIKKKAAAVSGNSATLSTPEEYLGNGVGASTATRNRKLEHVKSDSSGASDAEDDEYEDDTAGARTAAINQEIKRILTEVLLKVTEDIFDEIAQEVMDEDEEKLSEAAGLDNKTSDGDREETAASAPRPSPSAAPEPSPPARALLASSKLNQSSGEDDSDSLSSGVPAGNLLGLASYASDDEDGEKGCLASEALPKKLESQAQDNGEGKERNQRQKDDLRKSVEGIVGDKETEWITEKTGRVETKSDRKGMKRPNDESSDYRSPRRARFTEKDSCIFTGQTDAGGKEDIPQQNHLSESDQDHGHGSARSAKVGSAHVLQPGEEDVTGKGTRKSRAEHSSNDAKDNVMSHSKQEMSKRDMKFKESSIHRDGEKPTDGQVPESNQRGRRTLKDGDLLRKDYDHVDWKARETQKVGDSTHYRKRGGHRDKEKDHLKDTDRGRKPDCRVDIDKHREETQVRSRSRERGRRLEKGLESRSRDKQKDYRDTRDSRRRRQRSSSTGSRGRSNSRSRSTNH